MKGTQDLSVLFLATSCKSIMDRKTGFPKQWPLVFTHCQEWGKHSKTIPSPIFILHRVQKIETWSIEHEWESISWDWDSRPRLVFLSDTRVPRTSPAWLDDGAGRTRLWNGWCLPKRVLGKKLLDQGVETLQGVKMRRGHWEHELDQPLRGAVCRCPLQF